MISKTVIGCILVGLQLIRAPGLRFYPGGEFNAEIAGYDGFALAMHIRGAWLI
jgi:hypothetical protein